MYEMIQMIRGELAMLINFSGKKRKISTDPSTTETPTNSSVPGVPDRDEDNTCSIHIGERLAKLEQLFERFVCRKNSVAGTSDTVRSPTLVGSNEKLPKFGSSDAASDTQSISTIGEGIVSISQNSPAVDLLNSFSSVHRVGRQHRHFVHYRLHRRMRNPPTVTMFIER